MVNPTLQELIDRSNADFVDTFDGIDPTIPQSFAGAFSKMIAGRAFEIYGSLELLVDRLLLNSSTDDFLDARASALKMTRNAATTAKGTLIIPGSVGIDIPASTIFNSDTGISYSTDALATVVAFSDTLASFSVSGIVVTVTTSVNHDFGTGLSVTILATNLPAQIVGVYQIVVTSANSFTYTTSTAAPNGVYPNGTVQVNRAVATVTSTTSGSAANATSGAQLTIESPLISINATAFVSYDSITGGEDVENDANFRKRVLYRVRNPIAYQSVSMITNYMYSLGGITRVWVRKLTPVNGFTVYYVRDNQNPIFPSPADIAEVYANFPIPAVIPAVNVVIAAPIERSIEFTFASLTPDTTAMREAVEASLQQFFRDIVTMGFESGTITVNQFTRPIQAAIDITTGAPIEDFVLSTVDGLPPADILIQADELPTLGVITY